MKTQFTALLLLLASSLASAETTSKLTWNIAGFIIGGTTFATLELDVTGTGRYLAAHGAILTETRQLSPATGTCAPITAGYFCNLQIASNDLFLTLDNKGNGKIFGSDRSGGVLAEVPATLLSKQ